MKSIKGIINEYVERNDIKGLQTYAYAMVEDWMVDVEKAKEEQREEDAKIAEDYKREPIDPRFNPFAKIFNDEGHPIENETKDGIATAIRNNGMVE